MARRKKSATVDLKVRMKEPLRASLATAAKRRGVSMNAEAVDRLEQSFHHQALLIEVLEAAFGKPLAATLLTLGRAMDHAGRHSAFSHTRTLESASGWFDNPVSYNQAAEAATTVLERLRPAGDPTVRGADKFPSFKTLGVGFANTYLDYLAGIEGATMADEQWATSLRDTLGPRVDRINHQRKGSSK